MYVVVPPPGLAVTDPLAAALQVMLIIPLVLAVKGDGWVIVTGYDKEQIPSFIVTVYVPTANPVAGIVVAVVVLLVPLLQL